MTIKTLRVFTIEEKIDYRARVVYGYREESDRDWAAALARKEADIYGHEVVIGTAMVDPSKFEDGCDITEI